MGFQGENLGALGLGIKGDAPPNDLQPQIDDGVHLYWSSASVVGLPKGGYFVFRRSTDSQADKCLQPHLEGTLEESRPSPQLMGGLDISSATDLRLTHHFDPLNFREIELPPNSPLTCEPQAAPAHFFRATVGFGRQTGTVTTDPDLTTLEAIHRALCILANRLRRLVGLRPVKIDIPAGSPPQEGDEASQERPSDLKGNEGEVRKDDGDRKEQDGDSRNNDNRGDESSQGEGDDRPTQPHSVCQVVARAWDGQDLLAETLIAGAPGSQHTIEFQHDRITSLSLELTYDGKRGNGDACSAVLIDLCWREISANGPWEDLPGFRYPMLPPVSMLSSPPTLQAAKQTALSRIRYGSPAQWGGTTFDDIHDILSQLMAVEGPEMTDVTVDYSNPVGSDPDLPHVSQVSALDMVKLAALNPAFAQLAGFYWIDEPPIGTRFDYVVLADHGEDFGGDPVAAKAALTAGLPLKAEAWIVHDLSVEEAPPLAPPENLVVYSLPETIYPDTTKGVRGAAALDWPANELSSGALTPGAAILNYLWRADHGAIEPTGPAGDTDFVVLNPNAPTPAGLAPPIQNTTPANDWPPLPTRATNRPLAEGWYEFAVSGRDIWGRHSARSNPAKWLQWTPDPDPKPWWFKEPSGEKILHPYALNILNKIPPPPPVAVEAQVLDPADTVGFTHSPAYLAWWSQTGEAWWQSLSDAERAAVIPARIAWRWTQQQADQNLPLSHFRIYFNSGSTPPVPDAGQAAHWAQRLWIVDYQDYVALDGGDRLYELFLPVASPPITDPALLAPPLNVSLASPVAYGTIAITAVDQAAHTIDAAKWANTPWGGQTGNESAASPPTTIWRVFRDPPLPPGPILPDERLWASKADYYGRSFWTIRWEKQAHLRGLVFSAMDEAIFMAERGNALTAVTQDEEGVWANIWGQAPQEIIDAINDLRAIKPGDQTDPVWKTNWRTACDGLSDNALRALAACPANEAVFRQETAEGIETGDFTGPDDPADHVPDTTMQAFTVGFDGKAQNRYFLRASYINSAQVEGDMSPPTPPIYMPRMTPPRQPVVTRAEGVNAAAILEWTTAGLAIGGAVRIFRTDDDYRLADVRLMQPVGSLTVDQAVLDGPFMSWADDSAMSGRTHHYRLCFEDAEGYVSIPSETASIYVPDDRPPDPPYWSGHTWLIEDENTGALADWPDDAIVPQGHRAVLRLNWFSAAETPSFTLTRRDAPNGAWRPPQSGDGPFPAPDTALTFGFIDREAKPDSEYDYRLKVRTGSGVWSITHQNLRTARAPGVT